MRAVLWYGYFADFVVLPDADDVAQHHHFHLLVTDLPDPISEMELQEYFQNRRESGGGPVTKVDLNLPARSAAVFFADAESMVYLCYTYLCKLGMQSTSAIFNAVWLQGKRLENKIDDGV